MSTMTRRGRKPSNFYRGRIPNANVEFIRNLNETDARKIQKSYHQKFGHWLRESTIESTLKRIKNQMSVTLTKNSNKISITINVNGKRYTPSQYADMKADIARVEAFNEVASSLSNG